MIIRCDTFEMFMDVIADLTKRGLGFNASADELMITLTGAN